MLENVEVKLNTNYFDDPEKYKSIANKIVYTGMIDEYFNYRLGRLEYRSLRFETEILNIDNFQGNAVVNYTERDVPYTRIIEHKHFEFGNQEKTVITREYPDDWKPSKEAYYTINDERNNKLAEEYKCSKSTVADIIKNRTWNNV